MEKFLKFLKKNTKSVICIALAVVIAGLAIFFAIYNEVGNVYDYADKDMSKYLPTITDKDYVYALYDGSAIRAYVTDDDVRYAIAEDLAEEGTTKTAGTFGLYDTIKINYTMSIDTEDGIISVVDRKYLDPANAVTFQIGAESDFEGFLDVLVENYGDLSDYSYNVYTSGPVVLGDQLYVSYSVSDTSVSESYYGVYYSDYMDLESIKEGLTDLVKEDFQKDSVIGESFTYTFDDDSTVTFKVDFASRTVIKSGTPNLDDTVFFEYYTTTIDESEEEVESDTATYAAKITSATVLDEVFGTGFTAKILSGDLAYGSFGTSFDTTKEVEGEQVTTTYNVSLTYRVGTAGAEDTVVKGDSFYEYSYTFPADSEATAPNDETISLAGKEIFGKVYVQSFEDVTFDYATIIDTLEYSPSSEDDASLLDLYLVAYAEFKTIESTRSPLLTEYTDAETAYNQAKQAYEDGAAKTGTEALSAEDLAALEETMNDAKETMDDAKEALDAVADEYNEKDNALLEAFNAYKEENPEVELSTDFETSYDVLAQKAYELSVKEEIQEEYDLEYKQAIAKVIWDKLLVVAEADVEANGYPKKAVKVAKNAIYDYYKTQYYENSDETPYSNYSTFKAYLTQDAYATKDYKVEMESEAKETVLHKMIVYRLDEIFETEFTDNQSLMIQIYAAYSSEEYAAALEIGYIFDNVMDEVGNYFLEE